MYKNNTRGTTQIAASFEKTAPSGSCRKTGKPYALTRQPSGRLYSGNEPLSSFQLWSD